MGTAFSPLWVDGKEVREAAEATTAVINYDWSA